MSCRQRDAATHTACLQVGWYIIFMAAEGGGGEVGRWWNDATIAARFWSLVQIPKIANFIFFDG